MQASDVKILAAEPHEANQLDVDRALIGSFAEQFSVMQTVSNTEQCDTYLLAARRSKSKNILKRYHYGVIVDLAALNALVSNPASCFVRTLECGAEDGRVFDLQEFLPLGTLAQSISCGPLSARVVRELLVDFLNIIRSLQERSLIYPDLRPKNIFLRRISPISIALGDFSKVCFSELPIGNCHKILSAKYHPPESVASPTGERQVHRNGIFWSLGIILIELLTGTHPLFWLDDAASLRFICVHDVPVDGVPDDWEFLIRGLLVADPQHRFGTAEITRWLNGEKTLSSVGARRPSNSQVKGCFVFDQKTYGNLRNLATGLTENWEIAASYCRNRYLLDLAADVRRYLADTDMSSFLDATHNKFGSDKVRLMLLLERIRPVGSPFFNGKFLTKTALETMAREVLADKCPIKYQYLCELFSTDLLSNCQFDKDMQYVGDAWKRGLLDFDYILETAMRCNCNVRGSDANQLTILSYALLFSVSPDAGCHLSEQLQLKTGWPNVPRLKEITPFINLGSPMQMMAFHHLFESVA